VDVRLDYVGFRIPATFVVGYGLDYQGYGRNLRSLYKIAE
jgi:hypoxanthine-guanine phosphoribosyltransferase